MFAFKFESANELSLIPDESTRVVANEESVENRRRYVSVIMERYQRKVRFRDTFVAPFAGVYGTGEEGAEG